MFYVLLNTYLFITGLSFMNLLKDNYRLSRFKAISFTIVCYCIDLVWIVGYMGLPFLYLRIQGDSTYMCSEVTKSLLKFLWYYQAVNGPLLYQIIVAVLIWTILMMNTWVIQMD